MKTLLLPLCLLPVTLLSQVNYTVTVTRLKATADDCDGGGVIPFVCPNAPQDPVFNIWSNDAEGNENHYCWIFDNDPDIEYNLWKDIQNVEIAAENNVMTTYISFDMAGFESDALMTPTCDSQTGDDQIYDRQFVHQFLLSNVPENTPYVDVIDLGGIYYAEVELYWIDLTSGISGITENIFEVFPNPGNGTFTITRTDQQQTDTELLVYDVYGSMVFRVVLNGKEETIVLPVESGIYFMNFVDGQSAYQKMVQVSR